MRELKDELASLRIDREAPRRGRWRVPLLLLVLVALAVAGWFYLGKARSVLGAVEVETVQPTIESTSGPNAGTPMLTASGYLVARKQSVVSSKIQGRIASLRVEEGSIVREGDILATLDNADILAAIAKAKADIEYAKADLAEAQRQERLQENLWRNKVVSQDALDASRSKVRLAEAAIEQDKANLQVQEAYLDFTTIRAPFAGIVVKKMTEVGESVAPIPPGVNISTSSGAIVAIADMNSLEAEVDVNESNVGQLGASQPADIQVQAIPNHTYKGVLRQVIPTADRTKATVTVKVSILDKDKYLRPEMSCNVTFLEPQKKEQSGGSAPPQRIITVPKDAVVTRDGKAMVFTIEDKKAQAVPITTGADLHGQVIVKQGLSGGEILVNNPPQKLKDGDVVKVKG
ncbi:MAG TPA: efflux RND transporter periplasmic adaptor subunit [Terriglobales bacterium]|jgi:RND family efflux transporter MFP subunit|nr:efflux RND transporter periplasmic adaptor subunit [Terriglobales bacterium]